MNILVIRTDNIGDLICTTPLLAALRRQYMQAWIGVLTNSYSAPALANNPDIDEVLIYHKAKHLSPGESLIAAHWGRIRQIWMLRRRGIDLAILAAPRKQVSAQRFARWIGAGKTLGGEEVSEGLHEAEKTYLGFVRPLSLPVSIPSCTVVADPLMQQSLLESLPVDLPKDALIGLHISARKPSQRLSQEAAIALVLALLARGHHILLFWSPGAENNALHPGDDAKAAAILQQVNNPRLHPMPTRALEELIAGISLCKAIIQSDGGAMHVAAGLGKPIVCLFGQSDAQRWHPWKPPHVLIQKSSHDVRDISVAEILAALDQLMH